MYKKIYIIGPIGSGKTTFSKSLSKKYNIKCYELDKVSWDDDNGNIRRSDEESNRIFNDILSNKSWIMEDVGREKYKEGKIQADIIYYIKLPKLIAYYRVTRRWIRQRLGKEIYNQPPTFKNWKYFMRAVKSYYKKEKKKISDLQEYSDKLVFVTTKDIEKILNE